VIRRKIIYSSHTFPTVSVGRANFWTQST